MFLLIAAVILFITFIIGVNVLIYRSLVKRALKKYILPKLKEEDLLLIGYEWPGLFSSGDFKDTFALTFMNKNGSMTNSNYTYVYYKKGSERKKITVRIDTIMLRIQKVVYSSDL